MFLNFFVHSLPKNILEGYVDIHSHLLPGVDDGFPDKEKTLSALRYFQEKGVKTIVLTPHFMNEYPDNVRDSISQRFDKLLSDVKDEISIKLYIGGEYMLDSGFERHNKDGFLTIGRSKAVLCETSYMMCDPMAGQMLYDAALSGCSPIIAHPERYVYAGRRDYEQWKSFDYKFQLNILSLSGAYGNMAVEKSLALLDDNMYDYIGTDIHKLEHFVHCIKHIHLKSKQIDKLKQLIENNKALVEE